MGDIQNVLTYQEVADQVLSCVRQDSELLNLFETKRAELGNSYYPDSEHHLLTDDIIYFASRLYKSGYWPASAEYDPEISAEQWLELFVDRTVCTAENLLILKTMQELGGEATCKQLSLQSGGTSAHYNSSMVQLARRVQEKTGCRWFRMKMRIGNGGQFCLWAAQPFRASLVHTPGNFVMSWQMH